MSETAAVELRMGRHPPRASLVPIHVRSQPMNVVPSRESATLTYACAGGAGSVTFAVGAELSGKPQTFDYGMHRRRAHEGRVSEASVTRFVDETQLRTPFGVVEGV